MKPNVCTLLKLTFLLPKYKPRCILLKSHANLQTTWAKQDWKMKLYSWWQGYMNFWVLTIPEASPTSWLWLLLASNEFPYKLSGFELVYLFFETKNPCVKAFPTSSGKIKRGKYMPLMRGCATFMFIPLVIRNLPTSMPIHSSLEDD